MNVNVSFQEYKTRRSNVFISSCSPYIYESCDNPPTINTYQMYRDDENEGLKFYTDPDYIFHLWIEDQNQKFEKKTKDVS